MEHQKILILDFGGQYKDLIARRVREMHVYSEIYPGDMDVQRIREKNPIGIILTGGPHSVYEKDAPKPDPDLFRLGIPMLGICYGAQLMCLLNGGEVAQSDKAEYGVHEMTTRGRSVLLAGLPEHQKVLMSHVDQMVRLPEGFESKAGTETCSNAYIENPSARLFGVQFHPETELTENGTQILQNFLFVVCDAQGDYSITNFLRDQIAAIRAQVGNEKVILALSGGVDSAVCAALLAEAIPNQVRCIFVDHGLMRKNERQQIEQAFSARSLLLESVDASDRFLTKLAGVTDPEQKRKIIGAEFISVFREQAAKFGDAKFLAQGTIYPDIIESGTKAAATIKSHHNVGGLPKDLGFAGLVEPLRSLFKDEVRQLGLELGLPEALVRRQPFPGPGLAVRVIGEITRGKLDILREADAIFRYELESAGIKASQYFAVLTNLRSVGVMGDGRTYDYTLALRAINTGDFMTAVYAPIPHQTLRKISQRITGEVKGINRVVYDITDKPPATIEWE